MTQASRGPSAIAVPLMRSVVQVHELKLWLPMCAAGTFKSAARLNFFYSKLSLPLPFILSFPPLICLFPRHPPILLADKTRQTTITAANVRCWQRPFTSQRHTNNRPTALPWPLKWSPYWTLSMYTRTKAVYRRSNFRDIRTCGTT